MFSWLSFIKDHKISYTTTGPNVASGNIAIQCPFCGDDDPSQHMGLNLKKGQWGCWRVQNHRGKTPHRLIMKILGCGMVVANGYIIGGSDLSAWDNKTAEFLNPSRLEPKLNALSYPPEFKPLRRKGASCYYTRYLYMKRRFREMDAIRVAQIYDLRYCTKGKFKGRLIIPIFFEGELVCWTGRSIYEEARIRYLSLSHKPSKDPDEPIAPMNIKNLIWNYDDLCKGGETLTISEGPFDSMKLDFYGRKHGLRATCLFGTGISNEQQLLLSDLRPKYKKFYFVPDVNSMANELFVGTALSHLGIKILRLPNGIDDPGNLTRIQVTKLCKSIR